MAYWELNQEQRSSFIGRACRFGTVDGPQELYSFHTRADRPNDHDPERPGHLKPMYFMTKSNLMEAVKASSRRSAPSVFELVRQGVALCEDWNEMKWLYILELPAGNYLEAWFGIAKFQPRFAKPSGNTQSFAGGWLQYIVDLDERCRWMVRDPVRTGR